jgi:MFS family permease
MIVRVIVQWQRSFISFAYGYTGIDMRASNPVYEIVVAFPELKNYFGLLTGLLYTIPFAIFGMIIGKNSDKMNRKNSLSFFILLAGLTVGASSFQSFTVFAIMRVLHGIFNAGTNPFSYSLITEYFPPDKRAVANSLIHSGTYIGNSLSSISILLVT